ncbi:MAG: hypothetical protein QXF56_03135 [Candidatus Micrarchaeia archaeon]
MVDILSIINNAYLLYKENWRSVITAFAVIFLITFVFGIINFVVQLPGSFICDEGSPFAENAVLVLLFCVSPAILQIITSVFETLITIIIHMAVLKPFDEMAAGKPISSWTFGFINQAGNALLVIIFRVIVFGVSYTPFVITLIPFIPALIASKGSIEVLLGGGAALLITFLLGVFLSIVLNLLLCFLEIEVAVGGNGILDAAAKSAGLVTSNFFDVILFAALWFFIGIGIGLITTIMACTVCLLPLAWLIPSFIVGPVELLSKVILWRRLKNLG